MELATAIDSFGREKLAIHGEQYYGTSSRWTLSSFLWQWMEPSGMAQHPGKRASRLYLIGLTISTGGLQVIWTAIMSQGSPYLSSLGLPAYLISLVWLAGPLSGTFVQPCVGVLSDRCQHSWGRRKPFIVIGTIATTVCLLALPRTAETVDLLLSSTGVRIGRRMVSIVNGLVASAWIWALNIAIQPVQAGIRALIVDCCPPEQQVQANAYASCIIGLGTVLGYASGFVSLPNTLPWLGNTQFKGLSVVASVALCLTVTATCFVVKEEIFVTNNQNLGSGSGVFAVFGQILTTAKSMPSKIRRVCMVQFFAWLGWFPFLFYVTTYIGSLYQTEAVSVTIHPGPLQTPLALCPDSVRQGTLAMTLFAITALAANLSLPLFVSYASNPLETSILCSGSSTASSDIESIENEEPAPGTPTKRRVFSAITGPPRLGSVVSIPWLTLPRAWTASHILTAVTLLSTAFTRLRTSSTLLVGLLGMSWALTQWAPFALISAEIARERSRRRVATYSDHGEDNEQEEVDGKNFDLQAGTIMGVHNMAIATPQIVAAIGSSALFWALGRWGVVNGEATGWVLRAGGLAGFVAAWLAAGIQDN